MFGTIINSLAIIFGSLIGLIFKNIIPERLSESLLKAAGLSVVIIGIKLSMSSDNLTLIIISMLLGTIIGEFVDIEKKLDKFGDIVQSKINSKENNVATGFVSCTLIYCVGSMAIVGAIQSGLTGNHEILYSKSILDGIISITMSVTMGIGVMFSSISVFVYQGIITVMAQGLQSFLNETIISEMTSVGGILIMTIGFNFLEIKRIKVGNMLPAIFVPLIYYMIVG